MDIYKYVNKTNSALTIGQISILPYGEYITSSTSTVLDKLEGILVDKYLNGTAITNKVDFNSDSPVVSNLSDGGIRLDISNPTYGWYDLLSPTVVYSGAATNKPVFNVLVGSVKDYQFILNDESSHEFHMPHDYLLGSDMYIHVHWTHNSSSVTTGSVTWQFDATYARGYSRGIFNTPIVITVDQNAPTTALTHMIAETKLSAIAGAGGLLDTNLLEPDGIIKLRLKLIANTCGANPFVHFCDAHYQTTGLPTKNRNYDFYT